MADMRHVRSSRIAFDSCSDCHGFVDSLINRPGPLICVAPPDGDNDAGAAEMITCESNVPSWRVEPQEKFWII